MASCSLFAIYAELILVSAEIDIICRSIVGNGMTAAPETVGVVVVGEGVGQFGVALVVPGVFATHVVAIAEGTSVFGIIDEVTPGFNNLLIGIIHIIQRVGFKLGILVLEGEHAQFVSGFLDKVFFGNFC